MVRMRFERKTLVSTWVVLLCCSFFRAEGQEFPAAQRKNTLVTQKSARTTLERELPADWTAAWSDPPAELRPLQIVHGVPAQQASPAGMMALKELGLGGIVCNVDFKDYMVSQAHWETLIQAVEACRQAGLVVWLYDEDGYPSGAAGVLVLKHNRDFEARALTFDP